MAQLRYWIWLSTLSGLSLLGQQRALRFFGSPKEVFLADEKAISEVAGLSRKEREALAHKDLRRADDVLEQCRSTRIEILTYQDAMYPYRLKNIDTAPLVLYYRGKLLPFDELPAIAVVGSRSASSYGLLAAKQLGYQLGASGGLVISGAARGVDSLALEGALSSGAPVAAVLGNGLDIVYPAEARGLYNDIVKNGCLISESIPGTPPLAQNFPKRNRLMSGLSLGVLVVEAPVRSGSLITAELALEQGRDVFAVPGNIGLAVCEGSNRLIQDGAKLVTCGWDILEEYQERFPQQIHRKTGGKQTTLAPRDTQPPRREALAEKPGKAQNLTEKRENSMENEKKQTKNRENGIDNPENTNYIDLKQINLSADEIAITTVLRQGQRHVDDIIAETGLSPASVLASLTLLEVKGFVTQQPGKRFDLNI